MGKGWKWLAVLFAVLCPLAALLGTGTFTQVNGVTSALRDFFDPNNAYTVAIPGIGTYSLVTIIASIILTVVVGIVLIGGIKRIATVSEFILCYYFNFNVNKCNCRTCSIWNYHKGSI